MHISITPLARLHAALADPLRLRILNLLLERELCVCEINRVIQEPQYKISRHLGVMKKAGLVRDWREGTWIHYELHPDLPKVWRAGLDCMRKAWREDPLIEDDLRRLKQTSTRAVGAPALCR